MIKAAGLDGRVFSDRQLSEIAGGSDARRYGLVNRALKEGTMVRLKRGLYALNPDRTGKPLHPFYIAQSCRPGSYISLETALSWHGWIPEAVTVTASVVPGRKSFTYENRFGRFAFHPLALQPFQFLTGVERVIAGGRPVLVAGPLRALTDLAAYRKLRWAGPAQVTDGMRIDTELFDQVEKEDFWRLKNVYKHSAARDFLSGLEASFGSKTGTVATRRPPTPEMQHD